MVVRMYIGILLILMAISSCVSDSDNYKRKITNSYIHYLEAFRRSGIPLLSGELNDVQNSNTLLEQSLQTDKDLHYYPATLWQLYALEGGEHWKNQAESLTELIRNSLITAEPGNSVLIRNSFLLPYQLTGDQSYSKILIESLNEQIVNSESDGVCIDNSVYGTEHSIEKLQENELLFFASRETGDPIYRELALYQSEQVYELHFQNNLSDEVFFGLANWNNVPGIKEMEELDSYDLYRLSLSFYSFSFLHKETGDARYGTTAGKLASLFELIFENDVVGILHKLDLTSRILISLALSGLPDDSEGIYSKISTKIFKAIIGDLNMGAGPGNEEYSFRMYYYLFKCLLMDNERSLLCERLKRP